MAAGFAEKFSLHFLFCARLIFSSKRKRKFFCSAPRSMRGAAGLRFGSGAAEFPPHPPSAAPSRELAKFFGRGRFFDNF